MVSSRYQHQHRSSYPSPGQEYHRGQETRSMAEYYSAQQVSTQYYTQYCSVLLSWTLHTGQLLH